MKAHPRTEESVQSGQEEATVFAHLRTLHATMERAENSNEQATVKRAWMALREELFLQHKKLVPHMIKNMGLRVTDDRIQEGSIALLRAIDKADLETLAGGNTFSTFACTCIAHRLQLEFSYKNARKRQAKVISADTPRVLPLAYQTERRVPGLSDDPDPGVHTWHRTTLGDSFPSNDPPPEKEVIERDTQEYIGELLKYLPQRSAEILRRYNGIEGDGPESLRDIGNVLSISRERVRQIKHRALSKLRNIIESRLSRQRQVRPLGEDF